LVVAGLSKPVVQKVVRASQRKRVLKDTCFWCLR